MPPTVMEKLQTQSQLDSLAACQTPPQILQITLNQSNRAVLEDTTAELAAVLDLCRGKIMPMLVLDQADPQALAALLQQRGETDLFVVSASQTTLRDFMALGLPLVYGVYRANPAKDIISVAKEAHCASATTVLFASLNQVTAQDVRYLQSRFLTVFLDGTVADDAYSVCQAIDTGADGVAVTNAQTAYEMYAVPERTEYIHKPIIVGHRGYPSEVPENTIEGMIAAFEADVDAVECDVYLTADNHIVINHNGNLEGYTTDATATESVTKLTREQLKQYTLKPVGEYTDCKFAFLDEMFEVLKRYPDKILVVELKTGKKAIVEKIYAMAQEYGVLDQIVVISFILDQLGNCRTIMPEIGASFLLSMPADALQATEETLAKIMPIGTSASPDGASATKEIRKLLYLRGIGCNVWTINGSSALRNQPRYGVMHITTNDAELAVDLRESLELATSDILWEDLKITLPLFGDPDANGTVNAGDALLILQAAVGKASLNQRQATLAEVDGDGVINAKDALLVLQKAVQKIKKFPVEQ